MQQLTLGKPEVIRRSTMPGVREVQQQRINEWFSNRGRGDMGSLTIELPTGYRCGRPRREFRAIGDNPMTPTTSAGGYLIAEQFAETLEAAAESYAPLWTLCDSVSTAKGGDFRWGLLDDRANFGRVIMENTPLDDKPFTAGQLVLRAYLINSDAITIPWELKQDASPAFLPFVHEVLATRIMRTMGRMLTTGSGVDEPRGILKDADVAVTSPSISETQILDLINSVDPFYRRPLHNPGFMGNDNTRTFLASLRDGVGRLVFPELNGPEPRLLSYPFWVNPSMPDLEPGTRPLIFGAMRKFKIRTVAEINVRSHLETRAEHDQVLYFATWRADSGIAKASETDRPIRCIEVANS